MLNRLIEGSSSYIIYIDFEGELGLPGISHKVRNVCEDSTNNNLFYPLELAQTFALYKQYYQRGSLSFIVFFHPPTNGVVPHAFKNSGQESLQMRPH